MRPGVDVISRALPPPRSAPTNTGVGFVVGATAIGPQVGLVHSMTEYVGVFGDRGTVAGPQATYDSADAFFHEGGSLLYVGSTSGAPGTIETLGVPTEEEPEAKTKSGSSGASASTQSADAPTGDVLDALTKDLGPGQVWIADLALAADPANQSALLAHAAATNRVALLSCADTDSPTIIGAATALQTDANARYGALFAPSAVVPGVVAGTTRKVPYAAVEAGIIARNDAVFTANQPAAGDLGQTVWTLDVAARFTDQEYSDLNKAGASMARVLYGGVRTYGYRTVVDPDASPEWLDFGWARLNMEIVAQAESIGEHYVFSQIDGRGLTIAQFDADLTAMLAVFYDAGSLFGATAADAFDVITDASVNTPTTIANGELHAVLKVKMSPQAEWVVIEIVKIATTEALAPLATAVAA